MEKHELEALQLEINGLLDELSNQSGDQEVIHLMEEWLYTRMGHVYKVMNIGGKEYETKD